MRDSKRIDGSISKSERFYSLFCQSSSIFAIYGTPAPARDSLTFNVCEYLRRGSPVCCPIVNGLIKTPGIPFHFDSVRLASTAEAVRLECLV